MKGQNRMVFVLLIAVVVVAALLSGFGLNWLHQTPPVQLASPAPETAPPASTGGPLGDYIKVDVTPETVQSVIVTLNRPASYRRVVTIQTWWGTAGSSATTAEVWVDGGWTRVAANLPGGRVEHTLVGDEKLYLWYDDELDWYEGPDDGQSADLAQRIPTYEYVLALDKRLIAATGYEQQGGLSCIYLEIEQKELGYLERYWVSVETGLLVCAETLKGDELVYRMSAYEVESPAPPGTQFSLPDGTALHTVGG